MDTENDLAKDELYKQLADDDTFLGWLSMTYNMEISKGDHPEYSKERREFMGVLRDMFGNEFIDTEGGTK